MNSLFTTHQVLSSVRERVIIFLVDLFAFCYEIGFLEYTEIYFSIIVSLSVFSL